MRRRAGLLLALCVASAAHADAGGPLPGEIVARIGQVAAIPAEERAVPGFSGAWRPLAAQRKILARIEALEARATPSCEAVAVLTTVQAAPDLIETRPARVHHALDRWTVEACGARHAYDVWFRYEARSSQVEVVNSAAAELQADLDPAYRRLRELAVERRAEEASGTVRWLNLPLPPDSLPAANSGARAGVPWSADFVPEGEDYRAWTQMVSVQGFPRQGSAQALTLLEGMQAARARRCGVSAGAVDALRWDNGNHGETLQTLLVCPQRSWRQASGSEAQVRTAAQGALAAAQAFLDQVVLCDPAVDTRACPAPLPR